MQVFKYASMQVCRYAYMQVFRYAGRQECNNAGAGMQYADMQVSLSLQICFWKYVRMLIALKILLIFETVVYLKIGCNSSPLLYVS